MPICKLVRSALAVVGAMTVFATQNAFAEKAYVTVKVYEGQEDRGKVSGGNAYYDAGKTITLKATANKGYGFTGWFTDKACTKPLVCDDNVTDVGDCFTASGEYRKASDSMIFYYEAINKARNIYAQFLPKDSDSISLRTALGSKDWWETGAMGPLGMTYISYAVDSGTLPTVSAKGLPPGFKLDTKKSWIEVDYSKVKPGAVYENVQLIAKNLTGLTDVKTFTVYIGNYKSSLVPNLKTATDAYKAMVGEDMREVEWKDDLKMNNSYGYWKASASGLPSGVKFVIYDSTDFWLYGVPSKAGAYTPIFGSTTLLPETNGSLTGWLPITMKKNAKFPPASFLFHFNYDGSTISLDMYYDGPKG